MENLNKYQNGKIYRITDNAYTECYIGSTTQPLCNRMADHRKHYTGFKKGTRVYITAFILFDKYGLENCKIELIEEIPCESKEQLMKIEGEYIRKEDCVNKVIAGRTLKEYKDDNRQSIREKNKEYYNRNFDIIKAKRKENYNKEYYKRYKEENNEKLDNYKKEWRSSKIQCTCCGLILTRGNLSKHTKRKHPESK
jgi:hypothetical protein